MHLTPRLNAHGAQLRPLRYEIAQMMLKLVLMRSAFFFFTFIATVLKLVVTILWKSVHVQYKQMEKKCAKLKQI